MNHWGKKAWKKKQLEQHIDKLQNNFKWPDKCVIEVLKTLEFLGLSFPHLKMEEKWEFKISVGFFSPKGL